LNATDNRRQVFLDRRVLYTKTKSTQGKLGQNSCPVYYIKHYMSSDNKTRQLVSVLCLLGTSNIPLKLATSPTSTAHTYIY